LERFTLSNISSMVGALAATLERRRFYSTATGSEDGYFANHCPCGAMQEDYLLHAEPGDVFFASRVLQRFFLVASSGLPTIGVFRLNSARIPLIANNVATDLVTVTSRQGFCYSRANPIHTDSPSQSAL